MRVTMTLQPRGPTAAIILTDEPHRKELGRSVAEAKREETRERRVAQALRSLRDSR